MSLLPALNMRGDAGSWQLNCQHAYVVMLSPLQPSENKLQASPSQVCSSLIHLCSCCRFPMAGPGGGALGSTRRGARYRSLTQQVSQAVGVASRTEGKAQADAQGPEADAQGHGTGMEEVSTKHWATTRQTHFMLDIVPASLDQARVQASLCARHDLHACRSMQKHAGASASDPPLHLYSCCCAGGVSGQRAGCLQ